VRTLALKSADLSHEAQLKFRKLFVVRDLFALDLTFTHPAARAGQLFVFFACGAGNGSN
jgi:hypothetical protein